VSSVRTNHDEKLSPGRIVATIVLALLALVCFGETGRYLFSQHHHSVRIVGSGILGVALAIGAWFALRYQSLAREEAREAEKLAAAQAAELEQPSPAPAAGP
jgi:drug/metabolite transporter (DMT)-like permease